MDPILLLVIIAVVVFIFALIFVTTRGDFIWIYRGNVVFRVYPQNIMQIHQSDSACCTDNLLTLEADTLTDPFDISANKSTQTDDSDLFITCYDHLQVQHQENLITTETLEHTADNFNTTLRNILEHSDWNFQALAYQLHSEFQG